MEITGTIKKLGPVQQITPSFMKREVVILTDEMYPQTIMVEFAQSRTTLLDGFTEGQYVRVSINLRGREWADAKTGEVRYFTSIGGWKIEAAVPAQAVPAAAPVQAPANPFAPGQPMPPVGGPLHQTDDDMPF